MSKFPENEMIESGNCPHCQKGLSYDPPAHRMLKATCIYCLKPFRVSATKQAITVEKRKELDRIATGDCPHCQTNLNVKMHKSGDTVVCPKCHLDFKYEEIVNPKRVYEEMESIPQDTVSKTDSSHFIDKEIKKYQAQKYRSYGLGMLALGLFLTFISYAVAEETFVVFSGLIVFGLGYFIYGVLKS